jgi:hypothetical protein
MRVGGVGEGRRNSFRPGPIGEVSKLRISYYQTLHHENFKTEPARKP